MTLRSTIRRFVNAIAPPKRPDKGPVADSDASAGRVELVQEPESLISITPKRLLSILHAADAGDIREQCILFDEMEERDSLIGAHMQTRKLALLACGYELLPADDSALAQRAVDLCQEVIKGLPHFEDGLLDILDAIGKGFSISEIVWDSSAGQWWPKALTHRPQRWFKLGADGKEFRLIDGRTTEGAPLNPSNFIIHTHHARTGTIPRVGLYRALARPFVIKNYAWKDWLSLGELFGMPPRLGWLPPGATPEQKAALWTALKRLASDYAAMLPDGTRIEFPEVSATKGEVIFERMMAVADTDIVLSILGQPLSSGGEQGGSYALGKVQERVRYDLLDADARRVAETLAQQFLRLTVAFNLGPEAPIPDWHWNLEEPEDLPSLANTLNVLTGSGLKIPSAWVYQKFGIPQPETDPETGELEEVLAPPAPPPSPFGLPGGSGPVPAQFNSLRVHAASLDPAAKKKIAADQRLRLLEAIYDRNPQPAETWARDLAAAIRAFAQSRGSIQEALNDMETLRKSLPSLGPWLAAPMLLSLLAGIADVQAEIATSPPIRPMSQISPIRPISPLANSLGALAVNALSPDQISAAFNLPPDEAIEFFKAKQVVDPSDFQALDAASKARSFSVAGLTDRFAIDTVKASLQQALEQGLTPNAWLDQLDSMLQSSGLAPIGAEGAAPLAHLKLVFRQNVFTAYAAGRYTQMRRVRRQRPYLQYLTVGDDRVRPEHAALNGVIKPADDPFWSKYYPPWGFGCRCTAVSLDREEAEELGGVTPDQAVADRYGNLMPSMGPRLPAADPNFSGDPAEKFFLNKGISGMPETPAGRAAYDQLIAGEAPAPAQS